jgi:hypothetical protein
MDDRLDRELKALCVRLTREPIVGRNVLVVATGRASLGFEKQTASMVADVAGRPLSEEEFRLVMDRVVSLQSPVRS